MGLTQISTGGVKDDAVTAGKIPANAVGSSEIADDAVTADKLANSINTEIAANTAKNTNATHTGEVTGSSTLTITDDVVDEANLKISNTGSDGQFLQKQSGNTGGLTWASANQYTHPNHSGEVTSSADGAQTIADNVVDEANLKVSNSPTNGQLLSAQSGNTGGLTWTDPPASSPQFEATASGAITAGKPVIINSNGTVTQVAESYTALSTETWAGTNNEWTSYNPLQAFAAFDSANNRAVVLMSQDNNSDRSMVIAGDVGDGDITWSNDNAVWNSIDNTEIWGLVYDDSCSKFIAIAYDSTNKLWATAVTCTGTSQSDISWGTRYDFGTGSVSQCSVCYDSNANVTLVTYRDGNDSNKTKIRALSCNSSGVITLGTAVNITGGTCNATNIAFDSVNNKSLVVYRDASQSNSGRGNVVSVSGTTVSLGSQVTFDNASPESGSLVFDPDTGKFAYFYYHATGGDHYGVRILQISGTSFNYGSSFLDLQTSWNPQTDHRYHSAIYDSTLKQCVVFTRNATGAGFKGHYYVVDISSSNLTASQVGSRKYWSGSATDTENNDEVESFGGFYDPTHRRIHHFFRNYDEGGDGHSQALLRSSATTNLTDSNFIGLAAATVADTATATVDVTGATNTGVSGLTVGSNYYVQGSGALSTSGTRFAGKAVAANKLIVDYLKPNAGWNLLDSGTKTTSGAAVIGGSPNFLAASCSAYTWFELHWSFYGTQTTQFGFNTSTNGTSWNNSNKHVCYFDGSHVNGDSTTDDNNKRTADGSDPRLTDAFSDMQNYQGVTTFNHPHDTTRYKMMTTIFSGWNNSMAQYSVKMLTGTAVHGNRDSTDALTGLAFWNHNGYGNPVSWRLLGA